jgi:hypothetical protein
MQWLPSDIFGLSIVMPPLSRRGFFMTGSAAAAVRHLDPGHPSYREDAAEDARNQ